METSIKQIEKELPLKPAVQAKLPKVLLMYITKVSGHRQATKAIQQALATLAPGLETPAVNGFGYTYPILEKVVNRAYMSVIKRTPKVWDYMYDNPNIVKKSGAIKKFLHKTSHKKLTVLFKEHNPDVVVCTQAFPCGMFADFKVSHGLKTKLIGVLTDFAPHSFWINEGVDYYVVPDEEARERFINKGVPPEAIKVYGIPIRSKFANKLDRQEIFRNLNLAPELPTILVMGGGQGLGPIKEVVKALDKISTPLQMIVITGTNQKLLKWLGDQQKKLRNKVLFYDYVNNVDELMEVASLIVTKPGGMTTSECLAKGLPMVIVNPIPGQEMRNTDFLLKNGIGIRIDSTSDIGEEIELLLKSPEKLEAMSQAARAFGKPNAAFDVAKLILDCGT